MDNNEKFVIDVAKERTYQNQNEEYTQAYLNWRKDKNNPYAYTFVHDTREHSYVAGEGFLKQKPDVAEHIALFKCLGLCGLVMLVMVFFDAVQTLFVKLLFPSRSFDVVYYSQIGKISEELPLWFVIASSILNIVKLLTVIVLFKSITKIPLKVALAHSKTNRAITCFAVIIMLLMVVLGTLANYIISRFLSLVHIDCFFVYMIVGNSMPIRIISVLLNCIIFPILCEVFFRGFLLQTFRQFGDSFAIVLSCFLCGFSFYDISSIGYAICCSAILGLFTIRTGSINTAIIMHISSSSVRYFLSVESMHSTDVNIFFQLIIGMLIMGIALALYNRFTDKYGWSFNIHSDPSEMPFSKKIKVMLSTNTIMLWLVCVIVLIIAQVRII